MAESAEQQGWHELPAEGRKISPAMIAGVIVAILLIIFIVQNSDDTSVRWIAPKTQTPLWVVIFVSAVAGYVVGRLIEYGLRRRRRTARTAKA